MEIINEKSTKRFDELFDSMMEKVLTEKQLKYICSEEQIIASWQIVKQRLNIEEPNIG
jgi:hypothetical protein